MCKFFKHKTCWGPRKKTLLRKFNRLRCHYSNPEVQNERAHTRKGKPLNKSEVKPALNWKEGARIWEETYQEEEVNSQKQRAERAWLGTSCGSRVCQFLRGLSPLDSTSGHHIILTFKKQESVVVPAKWVYLWTAEIAIRIYRTWQTMGENRWQGLVFMEESVTKPGPFAQCAWSQTLRRRCL